MNAQIATIPQQKIIRPQMIRSVRPRTTMTYQDGSRRNYYANNLDVFNPTIWAREAIRLLDPNMVLGRLIHRDWDDEVHKLGDTVNALIPGRFEMKRKGSLCESLEVQDGNASSIQVALNQMPYVSFQICDGEEDRDMLDLVTTLLEPAVQALAVGIDRIIATQVYEFIGNDAGHLRGLTGATVKDYVLEAREVMNRNNAPLPGRTMVITPSTDTETLKLDNFITADKTGEGSRNQNEAIIGRKFGFDFAMSQGQPEILSGQATATTTTTASAAAGATSLALTAVTNMSVGDWLVAGGDDIPRQISAIAALVVTLSTPLKRAVGTGATVTVVRGALVNKAGGYAGTTTNPRRIGWSKPVAIDGAVSAPKIGQMVSFGTQIGITYAIIGVTVIDAGNGIYEIMLDKPLEVAVADNDPVHYGPAGSYNFGLIRNAFALVNRPLPKPRVGALSSVLNRNGISLRVTITYDGRLQAHLVTVDTLIGVGTIDKNLAVVMYG